MCALLLVMYATHAQAAPISPRVRPLTARFAALLTLGYQTSPTLAALVDALERSDVIVHVVERWRQQAGTIGETRLVARAAGVRYLRIFLDVRVRDEALMALLGHELQHAWEIAQAPWVIDQATLACLYRRIGHDSRHVSPGVAGVDTQAAREVARQVRAELRAYGGRRLLPAD